MKNRNAKKKFDSHENAIKTLPSMISACVFKWAVFFSIQDDAPILKDGTINCESFNQYQPNLLLEIFSPTQGCQLDIVVATDLDSHISLVIHDNCPVIVVLDWKMSVSASDAEFFNPAGFGRLQSNEFLTPFPSMQFTGLVTRDSGCVYFGVHDKSTIPKQFWGDGDSTVGVEYSLSETSSLPFKVKMLTTCTWETLAVEYRESFAVTTSWYTHAKNRAFPHPSWSVPVWVNTHWQEQDVLEKLGGDPATVFSRMERFRQLLNMDEAEIYLHWYEWDYLGYTDDAYTECEKKVCGFDSHYPEYFPPRFEFSDTLHKLADLNVRAVPYINGRIFDTGTNSWGDEAEKNACKKSTGDLVLEEYGNGVNFAVMCPSTSFWQTVLVDTSSALVNMFPLLGGVYIDQIAAATPVVCLDPSHDHTEGWTGGYQKMLSRISGDSSYVVMTEGNVEQFVGYVDTFLALTAYSGNLTEIVPAFQIVYGGMMSTVGSEFFQSDLNDNNFELKLMKQFLFGTQLGWFSIGKSDGVNWIDTLSQNFEIVKLLRNLIALRIQYVNVFTSGHLVGCPTEWSCRWELGKEMILIRCDPPFECIVIIEEERTTDRMIM